jgi:hypothetical protein
MQKCDPLAAPDPKQWLALDEVERVTLVADYHRRASFALPNLQMHAMMHVIVENQIALGDELPVRRTAQRLIVEGLDRHEVIHAIASVMAGHMYALAKERPSRGDVNQPYYDALEVLTAGSWLESGC